MAGQRILLIRGLMDYIPGLSPMTLLKARLANEGYDVTMITHFDDGLYKNQYWDAVIGHSQGAIDALRDAPDLARYNPQLTIITVDPPRTSVLFQCVPGVRYLDLHTGEFGLGGGSLSCPQAQNLAMGGLHVTLPMRSDAQEQILAYLRQDDKPIEMAYAEPTHVNPNYRFSRSISNYRFHQNSSRTHRNFRIRRRSMRGLMRFGRERSMCWARQ
jgi:hypothetical protein